ncbi:MAG: radical SAM domain-containing protein [Candidatus Giovannonibacteria bacterium GW2011_GWA1_43_15]|uniref:Radical SAM domain-containing protein n=2 Tax=Candidatus Giovannoniibacteriota TaxID=1752738 RepID=A0A0G1IWG4_9BACT|nr:MAG: radical SAM domain-containing protein [Candidatus Giovannonibacteria bacterium GW2011_GWB1_43_13]KKS99578.1 MAG: radical SAM domain-containing protein [Candidatus Giovannonibacteria bacterium GW2011_GWA1_43_15]KKT20735.1 MAG: radical SAM domain-containing protein [Candidatus Giovannonibacteria bacterium GW2011_GWC2_43_8]KKT63435.1 MAG: radical SAM domain-containing protein [Candidatus Giovannonibacteria bacterium GW2011_GWA2_44_26]OGF58145.1 MAG: hypothetical protein A2652_02295 [Candid
MREGTLKDYDIESLAGVMKSSPATVVLFGAGSLSKLTLYALKALGIRVDYFYDNDEKKQKKFYCGVRVLSPKELSELSPDARVFICNNYISSALSTLEQMNFADLYASATLLENTDFSAMGLERATEADPDFDHNPLEVRRIIKLHRSSLIADNTNRNILDVKYIDVVVTERCSMKCKDCANLMQYYVDPKDSDLDLLLGSIDTLMKCIDRVCEFRVLGGEPFVNRQLYKVINKLVSYDSADSVVVYTNATIIPKDENLSCLKHAKVKLDITNYANVNESKKHDGLIAILESNSIAYVTHLATFWTDSGTIKYRGKTESELVHMFENCCVGDVLSLLNGKLYRCPFSANAHNLNAIPFESEDIIDLPEESMDMSALKTKMMGMQGRKGKKGYLAACAYCGGRDYSTPYVPAGVQTDKPIPIESYK